MFRGSIPFFEAHFYSFCCAWCTGIDDPYEEPEAAEVVMDAYDAAGNQRSPEVLAAELIDFLETKGYLKGDS